MKIKFKFKAIKYHGGNYTFIEDIDVPDELTTVEEQDDYVERLDKADIMLQNDTFCILDFFRYVKKPKGEKKPTWKAVATKWEGLYERANKSAEFWENNAKQWKGIALKYREVMESNGIINNTISVGNEYFDNIIKEDSIQTGKPVDITKKYSGGWLAPNGDFYGMDGEYEDMIHNKLADKLIELELIPKVIDSCNPDGWLCDNGWVKIHLDWVLYDGYLRAKRTKLQDDFDMPVINAIPLTTKQREQIALYGKFCYSGVLRFGLPKTQISMARFEMIESPMIWKLFDY